MITPDDTEVALSIVLGTLGYGIACAGYFARTDIRTKLLVTAGCLINVMMYSVLGMYVSAGIVMVTAVRSGLSVYCRHQALAFVFIALIVSFPFWIDSKDWYSVVPGITGVIAMYFLSGIRMKVMLVTTTSIWLVINATAGNWVAVAGETVLAVFGLMGIYRLIGRSNQGAFK